MGREQEVHEVKPNWDAQLRLAWIFPMKQLLSQLAFTSHVIFSVQWSQSYFKGTTCLWITFLGWLIRTGMVLLYSSSSRRSRNASRVNEGTEWLYSSTVSQGYWKEASSTLRVIGRI